jgi:hypothetical protein
MSCSGYTKVWDLDHEELIGLDGARGTTLRVTRGTLWVTLERDTRDVVLTAGDTFVVDRGGLTLIQAQGKATVCVLAHHIEERRYGRPEPSFAVRAWNWVDRLANAGLRRGWAPYA